MRRERRGPSTSAETPSLVGSLGALGGRYGCVGDQFIPYAEVLGDTVIAAAFVGFKVKGTTAFRTTLCL